MRFFESFLLILIYDSWDSGDFDSFYLYIFFARVCVGAEEGEAWARLSLPDQLEEGVCPGAETSESVIQARKYIEQRNKQA